MKGVRHLPDPLGSSNVLPDLAGRLGMRSGPTGKSGVCAGSGNVLFDPYSPSASATAVRMAVLVNVAPATMSTSTELASMIAAGMWLRA